MGGLYTETLIQVALMCLELHHVLLQPVHPRVLHLTSLEFDLQYLLFTLFLSI